MSPVEDSAEPNTDAALPQLDAASTVPLYYQLVQWITRQVDDGTFPVGMVLDPEPKMARDLGLTRSAVRRAMDVLARRRIITRARGLRHRIAAAPSSQPDAATEHGGPFPSLGEPTSGQDPLVTHGSAGLWREAAIFVPDRLTDVQSRQCIHDQVSQLAADAAEFVVDLRISAITRSGAGWRKWTVAYLSSTDPVVAHTNGFNGGPVASFER